MKKIYFLGILFVSIVLLSAFSASGVFAQYYGGNCTFHAYRLCLGNNIYWYDSCGNIQDIYYSCSGGLVCQYGQCVTAQQYIPPYSAHYRTACYNNSVYWYDSLGAISGLSKNCADTNSCTLDSCSAGKCLNTLKCDGSACATGSADYNTYCAASQPGVPAQPVVPVQPAVNALSTSFFAKQDASSSQWQKTVQVGSNGQIYFMISVANNSATQVDNVSISANIPNEISSLGNLQINGVAVSGDIISGVNIGSLTPSGAKSITFEGRTQAISSASTKQAIITSNASGATQSDSLSINFNPSQAPTAAVSPAPATFGFVEFLKRWYLWILVGLVLIFLFVVVFRRLSSNE